MKFTIKLTYFKPSGKYYSGGEYETECKQMWDIADEIRAMSQHPGLAGQWTWGPIYVDSGEHPSAVPMLLMPKKELPEGE
jgi:hypothetical protein